MHRGGSNFGYQLLEESNNGNTSEIIPLGLRISNQVWTDITNCLTIPHYSHTKRVGLSLEQELPIILGFCVTPVISSFQIYKEKIPQEINRIYHDMCYSCYEESIVLNDRLDILTCSYCGATSIAITHWDHVRETRTIIKCRKYNPGFYKRISHFKQWMYRFQGKERNKVTSEVITKVKSFLQQENTKGVSFWTIKNALRRLHLQRFYGNTGYIMKEIRGYPVFEMSSGQQEELVQMFISLSCVYENVVNIQTKYRVNMLSYPYIIRKLCELKKWNKVAKVIPFLKSYSSIINQDHIWCLVCKQKGWVFTPTRPWLDIDHRSADRKPQ
jgi:hypothetical protein